MPFVRSPSQNSMLLDSRVPSRQGVMSGPAGEDTCSTTDPMAQHLSVPSYPMSGIPPPPLPPGAMPGMTTPVARLSSGLPVGAPILVRQVPGAVPVRSPREIPKAAIKAPSIALPKNISFENAGAAAAGAGLPIPAIGGNAGAPSTAGGAASAASSKPFAPKTPVATTWYDETADEYTTSSNRVPFGEVDIKKFSVQKFDWHEIYAHLAPLKIDKLIVGRSETNMFIFPDVLRVILITVFEGLCHFEVLQDCKHLISDPEDREAWQRLSFELEDKKELLMVMVNDFVDEYWDIIMFYLMIVTIVTVVFIILFASFLLLIIVEKVMTIRKRLKEADLIDRLAGGDAEDHLSALYEMIRIQAESLNDVSKNMEGNDRDDRYTDGGTGFDTDINSRLDGTSSVVRSNVGSSKRRSPCDISNNGGSPLKNSRQFDDYEGDKSGTYSVRKYSADDFHMNDKASFRGGNSSKGGSSNTSANTSKRDFEFERDITRDIVLDTKLAASLQRNMRTHSAAGFTKGAEGPLKNKRLGTDRSLSRGVQQKVEKGGNSLLNKSKDWHLNQSMNRSILDKSVDKDVNKTYDTRAHDKPLARNPTTESESLSTGAKCGLKSKKNNTTNTSTTKGSKSSDALIKSRWRSRPMPKESMSTINWLADNRSLGHSKESVGTHSNTGESRYGINASNNNGRRNRSHDFIRSEKDYTGRSVNRNGKFGPFGSHGSQSSRRNKQFSGRPENQFVGNPESTLSSGDSLPLVVQGTATTGNPSGYLFYDIADPANRNQSVEYSYAAANQGFHYRDAVGASSDTNNTHQYGSSNITCQRGASSNTNDSMSNQPHISGSIRNSFNTQRGEKGSEQLSRSDSKNGNKNGVSQNGPSSGSASNGDSQNGTSGICQNAAHSTHGIAQNGTQNSERNLQLLYSPAEMAGRKSDKGSDAVLDVEELLSMCRGSRRQSGVFPTGSTEQISDNNRG